MTAPGVLTSDVPDTPHLLELIRTLALTVSACATATAAIVALVTIPQRLNRRARERERIAATLKLLSDLKTSRPILERSARTYAYRRFQDGRRSDPYEGTIYSFEHDAFALIGIFDAACAQIVHDFVREDVVKDASAGSIVGAYAWLVELDADYEEDQLAAFPNLVTIGRRWKDDVPEDQQRIPTATEEVGTP